MSWWKVFSGKKTIVNSTAAPEPRRLLLQALEPRMMFDGVAVTATPTTADASHTDTASHTTASVSVAHSDTTAAVTNSTAETSKTTSGTSPSASSSTSSPTTSTSNTTTQDTSKTSGASVTSGTSSASGPQVVFVESDVKDYQSLINQLPSGYEVVVLDS